MAPFFTISQTIARPVDEVFAAATALDEFPSWSPRNPWAKKLTSGPVGERTRFQIGIKGFGKVTNELREFEPNRRVTVVPLIRMFDGGHRWTFTDLGGGRTGIDHELEMHPKGVFKLMGPMLRSNGAKTVRETAAALQRHLEERGPLASAGRGRPQKTAQLSLHIRIGPSRDRLSVSCECSQHSRRMPRSAREARPFTAASALTA